MQWRHCKHWGTRLFYKWKLTVDSIDTSVSVSAVTLTANATSATYQWLNCNENLPITGQIGQSFTATIDGNYAVIIIKNNCSDTSA